MPARMVLAIAPETARIWKGRERPRIPSPRAGMTHVNHRTTIERGYRVIFRVIPIAQERTVILLLQVVVPLTIGGIGQATFRGFGIDEAIGLVRALVNRSTADLGKDNWLRGWNPIGRIISADTADALMMGVGPPVADIFEAKDPWLVMRAIRDRRADLRQAGLIGMIIPIIALCALDPRLQVVDIVNAPPPRVGMIGSVAPIRERHVIIDPDEIEVFIRPERIEMKKDIAAAVLGVIAEILGPVGSVSQLRLWTENGAHLRQKITQRLNGHKLPRCPPDRG